MDPISYSVPNNYTRYQTNTNTLPKQSAKSQEDGKQLVIKITPGEGNVSEGDKSQNTIQIKAEGPNNEFSAEYSREQLMQGLERRFYQQAIDRGNGGSNNSVIKKAGVSQAIEDGTTLELVEAKQAQNLFNTYANAVDRSNDNSSIGGSNSSSGSQYNSDLDKFIELQQQMLKQELFFSRAENSKLNIKA